MSKPLPKHLQSFVRRKVESGEFKSSSEVVAAGLRLLKNRDAARAARLAEMRRLALEGARALDEGRYHPSEGLLERVRERVAERARRKRSA